MSPYGRTNRFIAAVRRFFFGDPMSDDFVFGNIVRSAKARGWLYDIGMGVGLGLTACNAVYAYLITQEASTYPLWLGAAMAGYVAAAPGLFGISKANTPVLNGGAR